MYYLCFCHFYKNIYCINCITTSSFLQINSFRFPCTSNQLKCGPEKQTLRNIENLSKLRFIMLPNEPFSQDNSRVSNPQYRLQVFAVWLHLIPFYYFITTKMKVKLHLLSAKHATLLNYLLYCIVWMSIHYKLCSKLQSVIDVSNVTYVTEWMNK